jgi:hypothetical protein
MWLFGLGHTTDLQDATVPITVMFGGLSVFLEHFSFKYQSCREGMREMELLTESGVAID